MTNRDYAPIPLDYLGAFSDLTDAEFGATIRALLAYAATGDIATMPDRVCTIALKTMVMKENAYEKHFADQAQKIKDASAKGVKARQEKRNQALPMVTDGNQALPMVTDGNQIQYNSIQFNTIQSNGKKEKRKKAETEFSTDFSTGISTGVDWLDDDVAVGAALRKNRCDK